MKSKKGFIFIETITVLIVLMVSLVGLYSMFSNLLQSRERRSMYDNINDIYKVNIVKELITTYPTDNHKIITSSNCESNMNTDCVGIFNDLNIERAVITNMNINNLLDSAIDVPNTMKEYMKTLNKESKWLIVQFKRDDKSYYSSLEIR